MRMQSAGAAPRRRVAGVRLVTDSDLSALRVLTHRTQWTKVIHINTQRSN